jgi:uncharacterized RmlC-like cupin family protein
MSSQQNEHASWERAVRVIKPNQFDSHTLQTAGMRRVSAVSKQLAETQGIWAGVTVVEAHVGTGKHHHGEQETVIYVVTGSIQMVWGDQLEFQANAQAGDFIYVPPFVPHKELNAGDIPSQWVIARTGQEPIVVNLEPAESAQQALTEQDCLCHQNLAQRFQKDHLSLLCLSSHLFFVLRHLMVTTLAVASELSSPK